MPVAFKANHYREAVIKKYLVEKSKEYTFEKLEVVFKAKEGWSKPSKITITNGSQMILKGLQPHLEHVLGLPMDKWDSILNKDLNIPCKIMMLNTKKDPTGFREFVTHFEKATILLTADAEPEWTDAEVEAIRPEGRAKTAAAPLSTEAPVVNTSSDF